MIPKDLPDRQRQEELDVTSQEFPQKDVSAQERYERHGHYPAIFLVENQPALASRLERTLFERGFEVLHLNPDEASPYAILEAIRATQRIGAISIYSGDALDDQTKHRLASQVASRLLDLSRKNEKANDEEVFRRALALAGLFADRKAREDNHEEVN